MITTDITEWVRTELWDEVPIRICVIDRNYRVVSANRAFGLAYDDHWKNKTCFDVYKGRSERCELCCAKQTFLDGKPRRHEEEGVPHNGKPSYYQVRTLPITRPDGSIPYVIEMSNDITELKELEAERLEAERLAAVGQTVAGLAHGVKNLLMGLDGGMYIARSGIESGDVDRIVRGWRILEENVSRISSFVKEFLEFARGHVPQVKCIDPNLPAEEVLELFQTTANLAGIDFTVELDRSIAPAPMDESGIHTCLANLVSNALDACDTSEVDPGRIRLSSREQDGTIIYEIMDNGMGMDYNVKNKVFTNFFSTKATGKGTGLGLLTTRKIVQEHGGTVSFETTEGQGSVFRLEFPRHRLPKLSPESAERESPDGDAQPGMEH